MRDDLEIPYPTAGAAQGSEYNPRDYRTGGIDPHTRRMAIIAGSIGAALLVIMGAWSVIGHRHAGVPVVEADSRPVREKPLNKGGLQVAGADESMLSGDSDGKTALAPAPEAPAIAALKATPEVAPAPAASTATAEAQTTLTPLPALPPVAAPLPPGPRPVVTAPSQAAETPAPASRTVVAKVAPRPAADPAVHNLVATSHAQVQLAAVGSEEAAMGEWSRLAHKYPELLGGRRPAVSRTEHDGKTFYRLRVSGFIDAASAANFCGQLHAKGGSCAVASF